MALLFIDSGSEMTPRFARHDIADRQLAHAEVSSQLFLEVSAGRVQRASTDHVLAGQDRAIVSLAATAAAFLDHVMQIVGCRAQEQVVGADAESIVAVVADTQTGRDGAVGEFVSESVGKDRST